MLDHPARAALTVPLARIASIVDKTGTTPNQISLAGLICGLGSAGAAAARWWWLSLALWLLSRAADGLDGPLARLRVSRAGDGSVHSGVTGPSGAGGFLDIVADFTVYGTTVVGVAIGATGQFHAPWWPFLAVLLVYYLNGSAFLAYSSIAERTGRTIEDGRSLSFLSGLAEGTETIVVHSVWLMVPAAAAPIAVGWAVLVGLSALGRAVTGYRALR
jgi:phosphatidylglycerophosphate synthase